jgi:hypothetical protein
MDGPLLVISLLESPDRAFPLEVRTAANPCRAKMVINWLLAGKATELAHVKSRSKVGPLASAVRNLGLEHRPLITIKRV